MAEPHESRRRHVDPNHDVVTIMGGEFRHRTRVCAQCPWRVDQTGSFPAGAFLESAETAYDLSTHTFACHMEGATNPAVCAGFLLRGAEHNITIRLKAARGLYDPDAVREPEVELHASYSAMAVANGCDPGDEKLRPCR